MEPPQNLSDFLQNLGSLSELVMGLTFWGSTTRFIPNKSILGGPRTPRKILFARLGAPKLRKNCDPDSFWWPARLLSATQPLQHRPKLVQAASWTASCSIFGPKWCHTGVRELEIQRYGCTLLPYKHTSYTFYPIFRLISTVTATKFNR